MCAQAAVVGRVTNVTAKSVNNRFTYDNLDRLIQESNTYAQAAAAINYGYNDAGLRTNMTLASETPVQYFYDAANRLTNVVQGTLTASLTYDDAGRRTKLVLPNPAGGGAGGINVLYSYDAASRLTNITYQGTVTNRIDYSYDEAGNRVGRASSLSPYNLPSAVSTSFYNEANQQLVFGPYTMLYDANGNLTNLLFSGSSPYTNSLLWSARNQLTNMLGAVTASFIYDGLGRRVSRTVNGAGQQYTYDGLDTIMEHRGTMLKFLYFRGLGTDEPWHQSRIKNFSPISTNNVVYMADALGSIVAMADSNQNVVTEYNYEPFGATTTTGNGLTNSYKFTAREEDGTGLYYYRARYYHPGLGRFVSEDPLRLAARDVNFYVYASDNPVRLLDPLGLFDLGLIARGTGNTLAGSVGIVVGAGTSESVIGAVGLLAGYDRAVMGTAQLNRGLFGGPESPYEKGFFAGTLGTVGGSYWQQVGEVLGFYGGLAVPESGVGRASDAINDVMDGMPPVSLLPGAVGKYGQIGADAWGLFPGFGPNDSWSSYSGSDTSNVGRNAPPPYAPKPKV